MPCLDFRVKNEDRFITFQEIETLLGFKSDGTAMVEVDGEDGIDGFWHKIAAQDVRQRSSISSIIVKIFHSWMSKKIFGRMRETKVTNTELNWLYSTLVKREAINPTYMMIERWLCEATSGSGEIGAGCFLTLIAKYLKPEIEVVKKFYLQGVNMDFDSLKHGHYIGGDERKGFKVANTNISLPEPRLKLFSQGREN